MYEGPKDMRPSDSQAVEAYIQSWAKDKEVRVWDYKGKEDNSQGDEKSKCFVKI